MPPPPRVLVQTVAVLEKDIQGLRGDIRERDATIAERDARITSLKAETQQLAKFKFVLEYKLDEVKGQLEPKEHHIVDLEKQIKERLCSPPPPPPNY